MTQNSRDCQSIDFSLNSHKLAIYCKECSGELGCFKGLQTEEKLSLPREKGCRIQVTVPFCF